MWGMVQRSSGRGCWYRLVLSPDVRCVVKPALRASVDCPFCSSPASRIAHPASSVQRSLASTAHHPHARHRVPAVTRRPIRISRSRQSARTAPHAAATTDQRPAPAAGSANEHWAPFTHHYPTLPPFHPSSPFIIALGRASSNLRFLALTCRLSSTQPSAHTTSLHSLTSRTVHCYSAFSASPPTRHSSQHLRAALTHAPAVHCSRTFLRATDSRRSAAPSVLRRSRLAIPAIATYNTSLRRCPQFQQRDPRSDALQRKEALDLLPLRNKP